MQQLQSSASIRRQELNKKIVSTVIKRLKPQKPIGYQKGNGCKACLTPQLSAIDKRKLLNSQSSKIISISNISNFSTSISQLNPIQEKKQLDKHSSDYNVTKQKKENTSKLQNDAAQSSVFQKSTENSKNTLKKQQKSQAYKHIQDTNNNSDNRRSFNSLINYRNDLNDNQSQLQQQTLPTPIPTQKPSHEKLQTNRAHHQTTDYNTQTELTIQDINNSLIQKRLQKYKKQILELQQKLLLCKQQSAKQTTTTINSINLIKNQKNSISQKELPLSLQRSQQDHQSVQISCQAPEVPVEQIEAVLSVHKEAFTQPPYSMRPSPQLKIQKLYWFDDLFVDLNRYVTGGGMFVPLDERLKENRSINENEQQIEKGRNQRQNQSDQEQALNRQSGQSSLKDYYCWNLPQEFNRKSKRSQECQSGEADQFDEGQNNSTIRSMIENPCNVQEECKSLQQQQNLKNHQNQDDLPQKMVHSQCEQVFGQQKIPQQYYQCSISQSSEKNQQNKVKIKKKRSSNYFVNQDDMIDQSFQTFSLKQQQPTNSQELVYRFLEIQAFTIQQLLNKEEQILDIEGDNTI